MCYGRMQLKNWDLGLRWWLKRSIYFDCLMEIWPIRDDQVLVPEVLVFGVNWRRNMESE